VPEDPAGQGAVAGTPPAGSDLVTQALLMVASFALAIGLLYMVVVLVRGGGGSTFYNFLAALSVLGAGMGFWVGYIATYPLVTRIPFCSASAQLKGATAAPLMPVILSARRTTWPATPLTAPLPVLTLTRQ